MYCVRRSLVMESWLVVDCIMELARRVSRLISGAVETPLWGGMSGLIDRAELTCWTGLSNWLVSSLFGSRPTNANNGYGIEKTQTLSLHP